MNVVFFIIVNVLFYAVYGSLNLLDSECKRESLKKRGEEAGSYFVQDASKLNFVLASTGAPVNGRLSSSSSFTDKCVSCNIYVGGRDPVNQGYVYGLGFDGSNEEAKKLCDEAGLNCPDPEFICWASCFSDYVYQEDKCQIRGAGYNEQIWRCARDPDTVEWGLLRNREDEGERRAMRQRYVGKFGSPSAPGLDVLVGRSYDACFDNAPDFFRASCPRQTLSAWQFVQHGEHPPPDTVYDQLYERRDRTMLCSEKNGPFVPKPGQHEAPVPVVLVDGGRRLWFRVSASPNGPCPVAGECDSGANTPVTVLIRDSSSPQRQVSVQVSCAPQFDKRNQCGDAAGYYQVDSGDETVEVYCARSMYTNVDCVVALPDSFTSEPELLVLVPDSRDCSAQLVNVLTTICDVRDADCAEAFDLAGNAALQKTPAPAFLVQYTPLAEATTAADGTDPTVVSYCSSCFLRAQRYQTEAGCRHPQLEAARSGLASSFGVIQPLNTVDLWQIAGPAPPAQPVELRKWNSGVYLRWAKMVDRVCSLDVANQCPGYQGHKIVLVLEAPSSNLQPLSKKQRKQLQKKGLPAVDPVALDRIIYILSGGCGGANCYYSCDGELTVESVIAEMSNDVDLDVLAMDNVVAGSAGASLRMPAPALSCATFNTDSGLIDCLFDHAAIMDLLRPNVPGLQPSFDVTKARSWLYAIEQGDSVCSRAAADALHQERRCEQDQGEIAEDTAVATLIREPQAQPLSTAWLDLATGDSGAYKEGNLGSAPDPNGNQSSGALYIVLGIGAAIFVVCAMLLALLIASRRRKLAAATATATTTTKAASSMRRRRGSTAAKSAAHTHVRSSSRGSHRASTRLSRQVPKGSNSPKVSQASERQTFVAQANFI